MDSDRFEGWEEEEQITHKDIKIVFGMVMFFLIAGLVIRSGIIILFALLLLGVGVLGLKMIGDEDDEGRQNKETEKIALHTEDCGAKANDTEASLEIDR